MAFNKKQLRKDTKELNKAKAPGKPRDIIYDPAGYWNLNNQGKPVRVPSDTITMKPNPVTGKPIPFPVMAVPNVGQPQIMYPGYEYVFPGADYVDEFPKKQFGGEDIPVIEDAGSYNEEGFWVPDWESMKAQAKKLNAKTVKTKHGSMIYFDDNWNVKSVDDNPQMKRGGYARGLVPMHKPSKKGLASKTYSRSLEATNKLFTENKLFEKPKDRKRKVFDPNAKYYADGGEQGCPEGYVYYNGQCVKWEEPVINDTDENTGYNAALGEINRDTRPGSIENNDWWLEHEKFHHLQNLAGGMNTVGLLSERPNNTVASDESMSAYYNRRDSEINDHINSMIKNNPELQFIPRDKLLYSQFPIEGEQPSFLGAEDSIYQDPSTVEGEARNYENYIESGNPSIFPKRAYGGVPEYAPGGSAGCPPGHYYNGKSCVKIPKGAKVITDPKEYEFRKAAYDDSMYVYNRFNKTPKAPTLKYYSVLGTFTHPPYKTINTKSNKIGPNYGSTSPAWNAYATKIFQETGEFPMIKNKAIGEQKQKKLWYTNVLGNYGFNIGSPKETQDTAYIYKKPKQSVILGKEYPKDIIKKQLPKKTLPNKEHHYPTGYDEPIVTSVPPGKIQVGTKEIQNLDPKTEKVKTIIEPVYEDNPMPEKLSLLQPKLIDTSRGELQGELIEDNAPEYQMPNYKVDRPDIYVRHHHSGQLIKHGRPTLTTKEITPLRNRRIQKSTGYDPEYMEGTYDEEGNEIPGEIQKAQQEGRRINFQGASSKQDIKAQEEYNKAYDEYEGKQQFAKALPYLVMGIKQDGGESNYIELKLTPKEIEEYAKGGYIVEDISVPSLNTFQDGGGKKKKKTKTQEQQSGVINQTKFQPGTYDPNELMGHMSDIKEVSVSAKAPEWVKYSNEYEKKHPKENFIYKKKNKYLNLHPGLNKSAGVTYENFPEQVEKNYADNYEYNKNNYIVKKLSKSRKFNPNEHGEWVEKLSPGELQAVQNSRYGSNLQPSYWSRALAGLGTLAAPFSPEVNDAMNKGYMPGLTKKESKEIKDATMFGIPTGGLETFAPMDIPGAVIANNLKNARLSTGSDFKEQPTWYSGKKMANVSDIDATLLNPLTYIGAAEGVGEVIKNVPKAGKQLTKGTKDLITHNPLKNTYKYNPWALKENPEMYVYRARPVGQNPDMNMAAQLRAKEAAGETLNLLQKNIIKMSEGKIPDMGGIAAREKYYGRWFDSDPKNLDYYINPDTRNFADDANIEILRSKLPRAEANKLKVSQFEDAKTLSGFPERELILPKDKINAAEKFPESAWQQLIQEHEKFNTPHWLRGYKKVVPSKPSATTNAYKSGTLNAGISPEMIKNAIGPNNKVLANVADQAYFAPFLNKTLNKISPLNYVPGYGKKLKGAVKPLGNVINKNIKNGNLIEQQDIIGKVKNLVGKGKAAPITTKINRTNADIYAAKFDDALKNSDVVFGNPMKQGVIGRTFNKKNAITPLQSKTTGKALTEVPILDEGLSLHRRLPFSNRYVPINKQKLLNKEFQWSTTGAGLQNMVEKYLKSGALLGIAGGGLGAYMYNPYDYMDEQTANTVKKYNIPLENVEDLPTRFDAFKSGFRNSQISPSKFVKQPDPYFLGTLSRLMMGYEDGGEYIDAELDDDEIQDYIDKGYLVQDRS